MDLRRQLALLKQQVSKLEAQIQQQQQQSTHPFLQMNIENAGRQRSRLHRSVSDSSCKSGIENMIDWMDAVIKVHGPKSRHTSTTGWPSKPALKSSIREDTPHQRKRLHHNVSFQPYPTRSTPRRTATLPDPYTTTATTTSRARLADPWLTLHRLDSQKYGHRQDW
jgi:hypothetical protein